jgi:uncharacterized SAM-binding protein YcdF (DUF218 family)
MYRLFVLLVQPLALSVVGLITLTIWLGYTRRLKGRSLAALGALVGLLTLSSWPPSGYLAMKSLEWGYPACEEFPADVNTIVVFGGGLRLLDPAGTRYEPGSDTLARSVAAIKIYQSRRGCKLMVSGGRMPGAPGPTLAQAMKEFFLTAGTRDEDLLMEDQSINTHENALFCARLLQDRGIRRVILVTEAMHMARSASCLRHEGIEVIAAPCHHSANYFAFDSEHFVPDQYAVRNVSAAIHEWVGLAWYWMRGWI